MAGESDLPPLTDADVWTLVGMAPGGGTVPNTQYGFDPNWVGQYVFPGVPPPFASTDEIPPANVDITPQVPPATDTDVDAMRGAGPPTGITEPGPPVVFDPGPPPAGGPEDRPPTTDFDVEIPLPSEPPPVRPPATERPPPSPEPGPSLQDIGDAFAGFDFDEAPPPPPQEYIPAKPKKPRLRRRAGRVFEGEYQIIENPPWWLGPLAKRVLGPLGGAAGPIFDAMKPEVLGPGTLPFPPIPPIDIPPPPSPAFPEPPVPPTPEAALPDFGRPPVPDVVVVTPTAPTPRVQVPSPVSTPAPVSSPRLPWPLIGAIGAILLGRLSKYRPIPRALAPPLPALSPALTPTPAPTLTPTPAPTLTPTPAPLTPQAPQVLTSPFGPLQPFANVRTEEHQDRCRCKKCKKPKKRKKKPSNVIAHLKPYQRRMSEYSLKNLKRG